jgi:hypothetical protein
MKTVAKLITIACLTAAISIPITASARAKKEASPSPAASASASANNTASSGKKMVRVVPFHGMISAVDSKAKTFTIAAKDKSRVFKVTEQTVITTSGGAGTLKDLKEKEEVRGSYWKEADGSLQAKTVKLGPPTEEEKAADAARKAKRAEKKAAKASSATSAAGSPAATESPSASPKP